MFQETLQKWYPGLIPVPSSPPLCFTCCSFSTCLTRPELLCAALLGPRLREKEMTQAPPTNTAAVIHFPCYSEIKTNPQINQLQQESAIWEQDKMVDFSYHFFHWPFLLPELFFLSSLLWDTIPLPSTSILGGMAGQQRADARAWPPPPSSQPVAWPPSIHGQAGRMCEWGLVPVSMAMTPRAQRTLPMGLVFPHTIDWAEDI